MRLIDRLREMGIFDRRSAKRTTTAEDVSEAVKQSTTQAQTTHDLVDELSRLELALVPRRKR